MLKVDERYLTLPEVAERLKVSRRTVYRWIKDGDLVAYKFANEYRITESALIEFLEARRTRQPGPKGG
jgi:excisionase family DNA binding protein